MMRRQSAEVPQIHTQSDFLTPFLTSFFPKFQKKRALFSSGADKEHKL